MDLVTLPQYEHVTPLPEAQLDKLLQKTKGRLFFKHNSAFVARLLCDIDIFWDYSCKTAWTDGERMGINPALFTWLEPEERVTLLVHEVWHPGFGHVILSRIGKRVFDIWNQAADHVINTMLRSEGFTFGPKLMSLNPCIDMRFHKMFTEQVYDILYNEQPPCPEGIHGSTEPLSGQDIVPFKGEKGIIERKIVTAQQAAKAANQAGSTPGETTLLLDEYLHPKLPWEVLVQNWFTALSHDDYSMRRPNRRYEDMYLPSLLANEGLEHLMYFWDISGSVSDQDIAQSNAELRHVHDNLQPELMSLVTFDHELQDFYEFERDLPYDKVEVTGRGGTCLKPVLAHIKKHRPTAAIIFSDLHCAPMREDPKIPVLWIVLNNPDATVPFGRMVHLDTQS